MSKTLDRVSMLMLRSAAAAAPKSSGRPSEDAYVDSHDWIGVADGVGAWAQRGINSGLFAQGVLSWCVELLRESAGRKDNMLGVIAEATERTEPIGSSTIVLAGGLEDGKNILHIANMGDSGCLVIRDGRLLVRTTTQQAGPNFPYQVCNSEDLKSPMDPVELGEVLKIPVCCGDIIICATDGILDCLTVEMMVAVSADIIRTGGTQKHLAKVLLYLALCGCKDDDKTVVVSLVVDNKVDEGGTKRKTKFWTDIVIKRVPSMVSHSYAHDYIGSVLGDLLRVTWFPLRMKHFEEENLNGLRNLVHDFGGKRKQVVDWDMVLQLPSGVKEVLDDYACGKLGLASYKDTGLVSCDGMPCLLLSHLGKDKDESGGTCRRLKEAVQASRILMLGGGRGSGKTRCLFTYFSTEERGLYFAAAAEDGQGWGSLDLDFLIKEVLSRFVSRHKELFGYEKADTDWNNEQVSFFISLLLAVRMKIYEYCKDKMGNKEWLLLQAACRRLVYSSNGTPLGAAAGDVFRNFLVSVCHSIDWNLLDLPNRIPLPKNLPTCAIDNIQDCWSCLQGCFADEKREKLGGLGYALGICFQDLKSPVIFSGAAHDEKLLVGGCRRSRKAPLLKVEMVEQGGGWKDPEEVIKFGEQVLGRTSSASEAELMRTDVYERFKCRVRFTPYITMLEVMLARGLSLQEAAEYVEKGYTTQEGVKEVKENLYKRVSTCSRPCQAVLSFLSFKRTVLGKESVVIKKDAYRMNAYRMNVYRELLELGLARLDKKKQVAIVDEYLVWKAYENKHGPLMSAEWVRDIVVWDDKLMLDCYDWLPLCFLRMWSQYNGVLGDMPVFKEVLQAAAFPAQLATGMSMFRKGSGARTVLPLTEEQQLVDFFAGVGADCTMLQWGAKDFTSGSGAGRIVCDNGQLVGFLYQQHYPDHDVDSWSEEIVTDCVVLDSVDWQKLVQVAGLDVYLCVVLVHPWQSIKGQPRWTVEELLPGKLKITLLLDRENMALAFTKAELKLLESTCSERMDQQEGYKALTIAGAHEQEEYCPAWRWPRWRKLQLAVSPTTSSSHQNTESPLGHSSVFLCT